jgi:hypothetical protein
MLSGSFSVRCGNRARGSSTTSHPRLLSSSPPLSRFRLRALACSLRSWGDVLLAFGPTAIITVPLALTGTGSCIRHVFVHASVISSQRLLFPRAQMARWNCYTARLGRPARHTAGKVGTGCAMVRTDATGTRQSLRIELEYVPRRVCVCVCGGRERGHERWCFFGPPDDLYSFPLAQQILFCCLLSWC